MHPMAPFHNNSHGIWKRIKFLDDWDEKYIGKGRAEDQIIALTWKYFVHRPGQGPNTDEPHWLLRYPMVKVRHL